MNYEIRITSYDFFDSQKRNPDDFASSESISMSISY